MASALTPVAGDPASNSVLAPDGGDARTASSVRVPMTTLLNGIMWLRGVLTGTISQAITLLANLTGTNGAFSGQLTSSGAFFAAAGRVCPLVVYGDPTAGVHLYQAANSTHVVTDPSGAAVAVGCTWRIDGIGFENEPITFATSDAGNPVQIQDPSGATLINLIYTSGTAYEATCYYKGGSWRVLQRRMY